MPNISEYEKSLTALNQTIVEKEQEAEDLARSGQSPDDIVEKFFRPLLCSTFLFRRGTGVVVGADEFLRSLRGDRGIHERWAQDIKVSFADDRDERAVVTLLVFTVDKDKNRKCFRNIRLFAREGAEWCLEFWYNYDLTQP